MKKKYIFGRYSVFSLVLTAGLFFSGCGNGGNATNRLAANPVGAVLEEQIAKNEAEAMANPEGVETDAVIDDKKAVGETAPDSISGALKDFGTLVSGQVEENGTDGVDYDLSLMSPDMVYASVYQLMNDPSEFEGKVFRMEGIYYASYFEVTEKIYHYVIVEDAAACCAQGIEFVWGDGSHVYPDEYPKNESRVMVEGTFETYREENDSRLYCRLRDAKMVSVN